MLVGLRSVTGAITRTIPTLARRTDITAQAGSSAAYSSEPAPGITAGTVIPGDGAGGTLVGTDTAAAMDIVADTDIAVAMATEARVQPPTVAIGAQWAITDIAAVRAITASTVRTATTDSVAHPVITASTALPVTAEPTTPVAWVATTEEAPVAVSTVAALAAVDSTAVEAVDSTAVEEEAFTVVEAVVSTAVADTDKQL